MTRNFSSMARMGLALVCLFSTVSKACPSFIRYANGQTLKMGERYYYADGRVLAFQSDLSYHSGQKFKWEQWLYYPNGKPLFFGSRILYPSGQNLVMGNSVFYPNGRTLRMQGTYYYASGRAAKMGNGFYTESGQKFGGPVVLGAPIGEAGFVEAYIDPNQEFVNIVFDRIDLGGNAYLSGFEINPTGNYTLVIEIPTGFGYEFVRLQASPSGNISCLLSPR